MVTEQATATDNIRVSACDVAILRWIEPCWDAIPDQWKLDAMDRAGEVDYDEYEESSNTTCIELDEYRVKNLSQATDANEFIGELAVGDGSTTPAHSDRSLTSRIALTDVSETIEDGQTITVRAFLAKSEANDDGSGNNPDLQELGLYAGPFFLNHSLFAAITKTSSKAIQFEVDLTFNTA